MTHVDLAQTLVANLKKELGKITNHFQSNDFVEAVKQMVAEVVERITSELDS